jgi:hypothetical protein
MCDTILFAPTPGYGVLSDIRLMFLYPLGLGQMTPLQ